MEIGGIFTKKYLNMLLEIYKEYGFWQAFSFNLVVIRTRHKFLNHLFAHWLPGHPWEGYNLLYVASYCRYGIVRKAKFFSLERPFNAQEVDIGNLEWDFIY